MQIDWGKELGVPDIKLAGLSIWVHQRQFPESEDYWDSNWLVVTICCEASGAKVWADGPIIHLSEISRLMKESEKMNSSLSGDAKLDCMEPEFDLTLKMLGRGQIKMEVEISHDHLAQKHWFMFDIDQSYLAKLIHDCGEVLKAYPIKHISSETI